jgi:hypothetical protein
VFAGELRNAKEFVLGFSMIFMLKNIEKVAGRNRTTGIIATKIEQRSILGSTVQTILNGIDPIIAKFKLRDVLEKEASPLRS